MTRINTNVSSLLAQTNLANANNQLNQALTRLSTGLRINSGADDPAGDLPERQFGGDVGGVHEYPEAADIHALADHAHRHDPW